MFLVLICYSTGVWAKKLSEKLKSWHLVFLWTGLIFDILGTVTMIIISDSLKTDIHGLTGVVAILLMAFHAIWTTFVLKKENEKLTIKFHFLAYLSG